MIRWHGFLKAMGMIMLMGGLTGCWDQHPVDTRAAIAAIGIDPGPAPGEQRYVFVFPNVTTTAGSLSSISPSRQFYTIPVVATGLLAALATAQRQESRTLYLGQVRILYLSTKLSTKVWRRTLVTMADSGRFVLTTWVVAAPNASRAVSVVSPVEVVPEVGLYNALVCHCQNIRWPGRGWRVWAAVATPGISPAVVRAIPVQDRFRLSDIAVLGAHHVVLWPSAATLGWAYLTGRVTQGAMTVRVGHARRDVGLIRGTRQLRFVTHGSHVTALLHLDYTGVLFSVPGGTDSVRQNRAVEAAVVQQIQNDIQAAWAEAQQSQTDPMGWHRDAGWSGLPVTQTITWRHWSWAATVNFTLREEGILR